jgi:hypothetical protein
MEGVYIMVSTQRWGRKRADKNSGKPKIESEKPVQRTEGGVCGYMDGRRRRGKDAMERSTEGMRGYRVG